MEYLKHHFHKMAFEYLMAYYMLNGKLEKAVDNLARLNDLGYQRIPRHYEELLLTHNRIYNKEVRIPGRRIDRKNIERFTRFEKVLQKCDSKEEAKNATFGEFGNTYYHYYMFYGTTD